MPSNSRIAFDLNARDIRALIAVAEFSAKFDEDPEFHHEDDKATEATLKSAIILTTAIWEAYCEDIAQEALEHLVAHLPTSEELPQGLKKQICSHLKDDKHELAFWRLADGGWRDVLRQNYSSLRERRERKLASPTADNISEFFEISLGIESVKTKWEGKEHKWENCSATLDSFVQMRHQLAHRGVASRPLTQESAVEYFELVRFIVSKTGGHVNKHVKKLTGKEMWS